MMLKLLYVIVLMAPCIWCLSGESSEQSMSSEKSHEIDTQSLFVDDSRSNSETEEQMNAKINWGPVWDDIEGHNEFVVRYETVKDDCQSSNGKGLQNLIEQAKKLLPLQQIKELIHSYANDPELRALEEFLKTNEYKQKLMSIQSSTEYKLLKSYACHILHIDVLEATRVIRKNSGRRSGKKSGGIRELLQKVDALMPHEELQELYKNLLKSDDQLVEAVAHLKSEEFHQMLLNFRNNVTAYKELREKLMSIGVPVDELNDYIKNIFGWNFLVENNNVLKMSCW